MTTQTKKILLSVTGMSPAVVMETLYALVTEKNFVPTEIRIITTQQGKNKLLEALLGIVGGRKEKIGALETFIQDYGKQYHFDHIHFDEHCVQVIQGLAGETLPDIRTPEENQQAADQIVSLVGELCQDENSQIHASIAGGRKTMGFFLGYALSLYGRPQDSLSHVLVEEGYEFLDGFFYPKPSRYVINNREGKEVDISKARVMLSEIPWVRLGLGLSDELLGGKISYSDSISKAQQILEKPSLTFLSPIDDQKVQFGKTKIKLSPKGYSLLLSLAIAKQRHLEYTADRQIFTLYRNVYAQLKDTDRLDDRMNTAVISFEEEAAKVFSESRNEIRKEIIKAFSIGKSDTPYIPSSSHKRYELLIEEENIDISAILPEIQGKI